MGWMLPMDADGNGHTRIDGRVEKMAFQMKQTLISACKGAIHESINVNDECRCTREWFDDPRLPP